MCCCDVGFEKENKLATFRLCLDTSHFCSSAQKSETRHDKAGIKRPVISSGPA